MTFPRHSDNSLNLVAFTEMDPSLRRAALLELKQNNNPQEIQEIMQHLAQEKIRNQAILTQHTAYTHAQTAVLQQENDKLRNQMAKDIAADLPKKNKRCSIS